MPFKAIIHEDEKEVIARLAELGLEIEYFHEIMRHYALIIANQTEDHPSWGGGITAASEAIYALRNVLRPKGWHRTEEQGFALTVHPEGLLAINVAKGDEGTGNSETNVQTASEKGICTERAAVANQKIQYILDFPAPDTLQNKCPTYYLLLRKTDTGIYCELSLPVGLTNKHITLWSERIIIPYIGIDSMEDPTSGFVEKPIEVILSKK